MDRNGKNAKTLQVAGNKCVFCCNINPEYFLKPHNKYCLGSSKQIGTTLQKILTKSVVKLKKHTCKLTKNTYIIHQSID